ncbi:putative aminomethyl transferase [uncultured Stenotrophomonas sp.]|uniref:Putative aminomethyl transferase n=1 Tax=uncultured Stenotrophomonas sp. TaxID=165438 RepID=A0A1Y5Q7J3_9GAMM|nr:putative aminomethyl transferase [uncultured Stenotrophomonas sp.]
MSDNLAPAFNGFRTLRQPQMLSLSGPDAIAFAHAQFASDVTALADGHWHWSTWLSAKGRVLAVFQLLRLDAAHLLLVCLDGEAETMAEQLRRFVFRRKLVIEQADDLSVEGAFQPPVAATGAALARLDDGTIELDVGSPACPRTLRLSTAGNATHDVAAELAWRQSDLRFGLPRLDPSQREQWTPQQLGLERLAAYSVKKGCYPGQEIVARTHFLGKAKRAATLLETIADAAPGDEVRKDEQAIGTLVSAAGELALAVLPLDTGEEGLSIAGSAAKVLPFAEGLAR